MTAGTTAFTWRRTTGQILIADQLVLNLKQKTGRARIDLAEILDAFIDVVMENPALQDVLAAKLR